MNKAAKQQKLQSQKEPSKANGLQITKTRSKSPFVFGTKPRRKSPDCCLWIRQACLPKSINNSQVRHRNNLTCQIVPVPKREALRLLRHRGAQCFCAAERSAFAPRSAVLLRHREALRLLCRRAQSFSAAVRRGFRAAKTSARASRAAVLCGWA